MVRYKNKIEKYKYGFDENKLNVFCQIKVSVYFKLNF